MADPVRMGIVGLGRAGRNMVFAEVADREHLFKAVAACDPIAERREEFASRTGAAAYGELDGLLGDDRVELVVVANRSVDHVQAATAALESGKLVLVEKPMAITHSDALRLVELNDKVGGNRLFVRHNRRFDRDFLHAVQIVASGVLGEVYEIKLRRHSYQRRRDWQTIRAYGGGQLLNWGPHIVDHGLQFLGGRAGDLWSDLKRIAAAGDAEDHVRILMRGEAGRRRAPGVSADCVVDIEISGGIALAEPLFTAYGTRGSVLGSSTEFTLRYLDPAVRLADIEADPGTPLGFLNEELPWIEETIAVNPTRTEDMWDSLYGEIRGTGRFEVTLDEAVEVMRVLDRVAAAGPPGGAP